MHVLLDIMGSILIGGMIIIIVLNANSIVSESWQAYNNTMLVQETLIASASLLEGELRNMGYNLPPDNTKPVIEATDTSIMFLSDLSRTRPDCPAGPNEIRYWLGPPGELNVPNERLRVLYRSDSCNSHAGPHLGIGYVTEFKLRYFQPTGEVLFTPISADDLSLVHEIEIEIEVQTPYGVYIDPRDVKDGGPDAIYATSFWRQTRLASRNLER